MDSKLIQILVFRHLHSTLASHATQKEGKVTWNIPNPGFCYSELGRGGNALQDFMRFLLARAQEMGGRPIAAGLVAGAESDVKYMHDCVIDEAALSAYVRSKEGEEMGARLWTELREIYEKLRPGITGKL